jgi:hypothetical protein
VSFSQELRETTGVHLTSLTSWCLLIILHLRADFSRFLITSVRFFSLYPKAVTPPDIQTFKAFIEFAARGIEELPKTITTMPALVTIGRFEYSVPLH